MGTDTPSSRHWRWKRSLYSHRSLSPQQHRFGKHPVILRIFTQWYHAVCNGIVGRMPKQSRSILTVLCFRFRFTFTNGTRTVDASTAAINSGNIQCNRSPTDGWYARPLTNEWYLFLLVPAFAFLLAISNLQPIRRREMLVMVAIACGGWSVNHFAGVYIHNRVSCNSPIMSQMR
jgi:hypothetical protein